jgi:hypothetical protein
MKPTLLLFASALAAVIATQANAAIINHSMVIDAQNSFPNEGIEVVDGENPPTVVDLVEGGVIDSQRLIGPHVVLRNSSRLNLLGGSVGLDGSGHIQVRDTAQLNVYLPIQDRHNLLGAELRDRGHLVIAPRGEIPGIGAHEDSTVYGAHGILDYLSLHDNAQARLIEMDGEFDVGVEVLMHDNTTLRVTGGSLMDFRATDNSVVWWDSSYSYDMRLSGNTEFHMLNAPVWEIASDLWVTENATFHVYGTELEYFPEVEGDWPVITGFTRDGKRLYQNIFLEDNATLVLHNLPEPNALILTTIGGAALFFGRRFARR